jgi:glycosyltransferase involved in cell wall biosynthesis
VKGSHSRKYSFFLGLHARLSRLFATGIITISETVREDMVRVLGMPAEKTFVAYPAGSRLADHAATAVPGVRQPFFLAVGVTNSRKNLPAILKAFAGLRSRSGGGESDIRLAVTGNADLVAACIREIPAEGVLNLGFVREGELRYLYENAKGLIFASRNEGFGIPLIDAAEFGCPVLCSDIPVFREVMGEGAVYFNPADPGTLQGAMEAVLAGKRPKTEAIRGKFSWDDSAGRMMERIGVS